MHTLEFRLNRRDFLGLGLAAGAGWVLGAPRSAAAATFPAPVLPYAEDALAPVISAQTVGFHFGKHHKGFLDKLNAELAKPENSAYAAIADMATLVKKTAGQKNALAIFNAASQVWNHDFYWRSLKPGGSQPSDAVRKRIDESFGGLAPFKSALAEAANGQFGSGWAWLTLHKGKLEILKTPNADSPLLLKGHTPLLTIDVWEHAYYLDYQNKRAAYVEAVIDRLLNWEFAEANLAKSRPA